MDPPPPSFQTHRLGAAANRLTTPSTLLLTSGVRIFRDRLLQAIHSICRPLQQHEHDGLPGRSKACQCAPSSAAAWQLRFPAVGRWTAHDRRRSGRRGSPRAEGDGGCCSPLYWQDTQTAWWARARASCRDQQRPIKAPFSAAVREVPGTRSLTGGTRIPWLVKQQDPASLQVEGRAGVGAGGVSKKSPNETPPGPRPPPAPDEAAGRGRRRLRAREF